MGGSDKPSGGGDGGASGAAAESAAATEPASTADTAKPQFKALYTYAGQHDDELAFNAGDIIALISKDEEAWWRGELDGRVGVFPSNYVEEMNCKFYFRKVHNIIDRPYSINML